MIDQKSSLTALGTAYMRAAHQVLDAAPRILDDPVAANLLGPSSRQLLLDSAAQYRTPEHLALRSHCVLRSRYAEDRLAAAVRRGVTQYVVLGAGFDTFALRQPDWARGLKIFEIDHSATQGQKRELLAAAGLTLPDNAAFATVDFERESLRDGLARGGVGLGEPTFFSWLGVTGYLRVEAIDAVFRTVAGFPADSEVTLTFRQPPTPGDREEEERFAKMARRVASLGEPFVTFFTPAELEARLRAAGFSRVEFLTPAQAEAAYFRQRPPDLPVPDRITIVSAIK